jgi:hypothetical protein
MKMTRKLEMCLPLGKGPTVNLDPSPNILPAPIFIAA